MSTETQSPFAELLEELDALSKALPPGDEIGDEDDDEKIKAAADGDADGDGDKDGEDIPGEEEDDEYDEMAKALGVEPFEIEVDGEKQKAYDGLSMLKAMSDRNSSTEASMLKAFEKSMETLKSMTETINKQDQMIKSLQQTVSAIGNQGTGRKAVLNVHEKPAGEQMQKSEGLDGREVLQKALTAQQERKITGAEVSMIDSYIGKGQTPPAHLLNKIGLTG